MFSQNDYRAAKAQQERLQADAGRGQILRAIGKALATGGILALILFGAIMLAGCGLSEAPAVVEAAGPEAAVEVATEEAVVQETVAQKAVAQPADQAAPAAGKQAASEHVVEDAVDESGYLAQALAHMPAGARRFAFTHWARVHAANGFGGNSQETSRDERMAYMLGVMNQSQAAAQLDSTHFLFQEQNWGWDSTDLIWEAEAEWEKVTDSVHLLQFRRDFDFAPLHRLIAERGFAASEHGGVTIFNVPLSENPDWHYRSHLAHHTFAFLGDGLVVMAPTPEAVQRALDAGAAAGEAPAVEADLAALMPELAQMMAVEVQFGRGTCDTYGKSNVALSPYSLLVTGHRAGGDRQRDTLFLVYDAAGPAMADFHARREILETGASNQREAEYDMVFDVQEATVDGRVLRYDVTPTRELRLRPGWPQTLVGWAQDGDAVFAGCGEAGESGLDGIR